KRNIQSIFPFRKNIWSEEVISKVLANENRTLFSQCFSEIVHGKKLDRVVSIVSEILEFRGRNYEYNRRITQEKLNRLLDLGVIDFNYAVFNFLRTTFYPMAEESNFPLLDNDEVLVREDIFQLLEDSGVG